MSGVSREGGEYERGVSPLSFRGSGGSPPGISVYANWFMVYNYVVPCADTPLAPKNGPNVACVSAETVQCLRSQNP